MRDERLSGRRRGRVALTLMVSPEGEASVEVLARDYPEVTIADHATYYLIEARDRLCVDLDLVGEVLGEHLSMGRWLGILSGYTGTACPEERRFIVTSQPLQVQT